MIVGQSLRWWHAPCTVHTIVSFRRYVDHDHAEVLTCLGSRTVKINDLEEV